MADFPKKQQQCLIPKYLLEYATNLQENHPDPTEDWGGGSGGSPIEAGTGIVITGEDTKTISVDDETVAMVANLSTVAFSGSYSNLSDKPDLSVYELKEDAFTGDYDDLTNKPDLSVYAETADLGDCAYLDEDELSIAYSQITGTPTIPTKTSELTNDSGYITGVTWNEVTNKPIFAQVATTGNYNDLINKPTLFSGDYDDLTNKPTIPTATSQLTNDSGYITSSSLPTNYVTTDTPQTITGLKYFGTNPVCIFNQQKGLLLLSGVNDSTNAKIGFTLYNGDSTSSAKECGFLESGTQSKDLLLGFYNTNGRNVTNYRDWKVGFAYYGYNGTTSTAYSAYKLVLPNKYNLRDYNTYRYIPIDFTDGTTTVRADETGIVDISSLMPTVPTNVSAFTNDAGYITNSALSGYATETWVGNQGYITGITSSDVTTALGYTPGTSNFSGSYTDLTDKPSIPSTASSTSTSTVTPTTTTLVFTYTDNTTETVTLMTGASVSTTTTTTLS